MRVFWEELKAFLFLAPLGFLIGFILGICWRA
jgi:hypothetical protein